ncbi:MAG: hypothetical protein KatS3mg115_1348 [Candidatus Poribacteria bacterium]|nr:MAG: hypothetical protein KatS3mg115_1348 [Candidatus Poribacteria bacterium]
MTLTGSIVVGSVAERVRFGPALLVLALWVGVGVPVLHHWFTPSGWATRLGVSDPLGGIRIHFVGGAAAAVATWRVGPRYGRFTREGLPNALPAHNLPVSYLGALLFVPGWAGWAQIQRPELPASELLEQGLLALAAAGMTATFYAWFRFGKPDIPLTINGLIAGLVGVSCGLGHFSSLAALLVGIGSGVLVVLGTVWLDRLRLDDPGGVVPMHGLAGLWGALAVGLLHREEGLLLGGGPRLLLVQALISAAIGVLSAGMALLSLVPFLRWGRLRATEEEQITGLDAVEHGNDAYADFQRVEFK